VVVTLKRAWRDGTTRLVLEPLEFLAKLAALTSQPEVNLLLDADWSSSADANPMDRRREAAG
jgi:hypothetical protein